MGTVEYDYDGETTIVTGGSSGIGREIALRFGSAGASVVVADRRETPKDAGAEVPTADAIREAGGEARYVECDVTSRSDLRRAIDVANEFDGVDVLVNNAGLFDRRPFREVDPETFERVMAVNAGGVFFGSQLAADDMVDRDEPGSIVNVASISSTHAQTEQVPYDASKGAIRMITRGSALELADHGIRVNAVAPGHIATEFGSGAEKKKEAVAAGDLAKPVPLGRAGTPDDIAGTVLFLASDDAAYVTGEVVYVDGGWQVY